MSITPAKLSALSTEYVSATLTISVGNVPVPINPLVDTAKAAFLPVDSEGNSPNPGVGDWKTAGWAPFQTVQPYIFQCLVGPSGGVITLTPGRYRMWVQILDNPETVIERAPGYLIVY